MCKVCVCVYIYIIMWYCVVAVVVVVVVVGVVVVVVVIVSCELRLSMSWHFLNVNLEPRLIDQVKVISISVTLLQPSSRHLPRYKDWYTRTLGPMMKGLKQGKGHEVEKGLATFQPDPIAIHSPKHSTDHLLATSGNSLLNSSLCRTWCQRSILPNRSGSPANRWACCNLNGTLFM